MKTMKIIGLTGGIGAGKSTVTEILIKEGYPVIDGDRKRLFVSFRKNLTG